MLKKESLIFDVDLENFEKKVEVESNDTPFLVDLFAELFYKCMLIATNLKKLIEEYEGSIKMEKEEE